MSTSSSTNPSYHRVNGATTRPNQKFTIEDDEEEIDLHNVEFGETSRHGLTTNDIARNGTQSPQSLFDLCTGLSLFGVWSTLTFGWMDPLLRAGSQNPLEMKDLPPLLPPDQAEVVYQRFRAAWAKQLDEVETPSLVAALAQGFGAPFAFAGCIKLVHDSSLFLGPLLLNRLIRFLADGDQPLAYGLGLVACLFLISLCQSLCLRQYFWLCFRTGMNLRAAVVTSVYAKTMVISGDALSRRTTGEISNLMSVDAGRLQELTPYLHAVWYSVFQIVLAMYCLWQQMGVSCLAGITVIVCMIPISNRVSFYMKSLQKKISKTRDERVKITNEVLAGMKVLKLQAWERQFQQRILRVREQELTILRGYSRAQCFATALYTAIPLLVALTTFGTYISLGNTLDIATALTSLALFELLRFPLFMLPQVVNNVVEALVSVERISSYLTAAEMTPVPPLTSEALAQCGGCGVELTDATFVYDTALTRAMLPPQLQNCGDASDGGFLEASCAARSPGGRIVDDDGDEDDYGVHDYDGDGGIAMTSQRRRALQRAAHDAPFTIASFVTRPPRATSTSTEAAAPRFASNTQRLWRWLQQTLWRGLSTLNFSTPATARGDISRSPSFSSLPAATAATASATAGATRPPAAAASAAAPEQKPLTAAEKTLLVQMAMFQDAEERLARLERDLQAALGALAAAEAAKATGDDGDDDRAALLSHLDDQRQRLLRRADRDADGDGDADGAAEEEVRIVVRDAATGATSNANANANASGSGSGSGTTGRRLLPLRQVTLTVGRGELVAIVGAVGSGKTSLLQALLGQLQQVSPRGAVRLSGRIAYCAQLPFIRNATLRDNVIFGRLVNERCYQQTLAMTALLPDLAVLPAGDATEIGERGINLSGGQKARVALARAVYGVLLGDLPRDDGDGGHVVGGAVAHAERTDVLLLDDVLAAVDAHVGRHLFEHCLLPLARERHVLVLWATNALQFTRHCDRVVVLSQGAVVQQGTYDALLAGGGSQAPQGRQGRQGRQGPLENVFRDMITAMNASGAAASVGGLQSTAATATGAVAAVDASPEAAVKGPAAAAVDTAPAPTAPTAPTTMTTAVSTTPAASTAPAAGQLVAAERSATGNVSRQIYVTWAQAAGGVSVLGFILLFFVFGELLTILSSYWLSLWSQHNSTLTGADDVPDASGYYLGIYGTINVCVVAAAFWREYYLRLKGLDAARDLFDKVLTHVLYAPMAFFDTTPLGRVTNRLSKDVYTVDEQIPGTIRGYLVTTMRVTITLLYVSSITPLFLVFLLPLGIFYYVAQRYYITTSRELTRLESSSRSPIYALFSETLDGLVTLRAYRDERCSVQRNYRQLDDNVKAYFCNFSANCWLAVRLEFVGTLIVMGAALFAVLARTSYLSSTSPIEDDEATHKHLELFAGLAGLSMSLAMSITQSLNWTVRMASDLESQMVAVERLEEYATMSQEKAHYRVNDPVIGGADGSGNSPLHASASVWPTAGKINFFNVSLRYRPSLPLVLKNVSFVVPAGHKVGVVGRTGAGKSSLLVALLRLVDPLDAGHIYLDDVDIGQLGLHVLRASVAVIPQDPVLFSGSVRDNLDPFRRYSDIELNQALLRCHLLHPPTETTSSSGGAASSSSTSSSSAAAPSSSSGGAKKQSVSLDDVVTENGANFSVGQRQLLCIARALVGRSRVILMDEATAAVDVETDALIQQTIRQECRNATVLTIAHRLNTILDSDKVLVLEQGEVAEYDAPSALLAKGAEQSLFAQLVQHWEETEQH